MKLQFLCVNHRRWLEQHSAAALRTWEQGSENALMLIRDMRFDEALPHAGCAFEAAEILLRTSPENLYDNMTRFTSSTLLLKNVLGSCSEENKHRDLLPMVQKIAEQVSRQELNRNADQPWLVNMQNVMLTAGSAYMSALH